MNSSLLEVFEDGVVCCVDETMPEYVKLYLNVDEKNNIKVEYKIKENNLWSTKLSIKPEIDFKELKSVYPGFTLEPSYIDDARTTPKYAKKYNNTIQKVVHCKNILSYADGYNFIGDAFINFVLSIAMFHKYPEKNTDELTKYVTLYKSNKYLSAISIGNGWYKYLDADILDYKSIAGSYRGLIGAIYKRNGPEKMMELMEHIHKELVPDSNMIFDNNINKWIFGLFGFASGIIVSSIMTLVL